MAYVRRTSIAQKFQDIGIVGKEGIMKYTLWIHMDLTLLLFNT